MKRSDLKTDWDIKAAEDLTISLPEERGLNGLEFSWRKVWLRADSIGCLRFEPESIPVPQKQL